MKQRTCKLTALLLTLVMALSCALPAAWADGVEPIPYTGETVQIIKEDGSPMGMMKPDTGTTAAIDGDNVVIHYVPSRQTFTGLYWGALQDENKTANVTMTDKAFDITLPKSVCGTGVPVVPLKADGTPAGDQYYLAVPAEDKLSAGETPADPDPEPAPSVEPIDYEGDTVQIIKADGSPMGMMKPDTGTTAAINGDNVVIHYVPSKQTYTGLYWGGLEDENKRADVTMGEGNAFDITLPKSVCGTGVPVVPLKADGSPASSQYYLAVPAEDKLSGGETPADPDPAPVAEPEVEDRVDLEIINNTGMFKALFAYTGKLSGKNVLVVALTGSTYHYLYKGNYAQALANGDKRENWIAGAQNADGKWVFTIPLEEGETYIPAVSISNTYLEKYEKGENPLERAFYPRQFQLDLTAKTLTVGDYDETLTVSVKSELETFQVADTASMQVVGGPNSNNFRVSPVLQMLDDTYDQITYPTVAEGKLTTATAALSAEKTFTIDMLNAPNLFAFRDKEPIELQLREKATGATVTAAMTVDLLARTITITGAEAKAVYVIVGQVPGWTAGSGQDLTITATRQGDDENTFAHFTGVEVDGKALDKADYDAKSGSVVVTIRAAYLQTLAAGAHEVTFLFDDGAVTAQLTVEGATSPATGDTGAWGVLAVLSGLAAAAFLSLRRRTA